MSYGIENIKHLNTREAMRERIQVYLGSDDTEGIYQAFKEIINNSTDEALAGYGNEIKIKVNEDTNWVSISDKGRGVPFGIDENGKNILVAIYTESHTGGKFDKGAYKNSSGLNGLGGTAVCMTSEYFNVQSCRNGTAALAKFKKGELLEYEEFKTELPNGTYIEFQPDKEVFKNMTEHFSYERICSEIKNISYLNKGIHFIIEDMNNNKVEYYSKNGIADFIKDNIENPLMSKPIFASAKDEEDELEIAFIWTKDESKTYTFVNSLYVPEGGSPCTGAKHKITTKIKSLSGKNFNPDTIYRGLVYVINCKVANPSFANQTKSKINNANLRTLAAEAFEKGLEEFSMTSDFNRIIDTMNRIDMAEKAADRAREAILNHDKEMSEIRKNKLAFIEKLSDAEILGQDAILCVVEGDSAGSSVALGRDTKKYGILRLRGKILNALKADEKDIFANEEIKMLLYALGIDIHDYNPDKLRYGKIAILVDPDSDGNHIALLIMASLYKLCPQFIKENRLYWLHSPLFIESDKNNKPKSWYYTDEEFNKVRGKLKGNIKRIKGLGLLNEHDLKATLFSSTGGQNMDLIEYSQFGINQLCKLMGEDVTPRKDFIMNQIDFSKYNE